MKNGFLQPVIILFLMAGTIFAGCSYPDCTTCSSAQLPACQGGSTIPGGVIPGTGGTPDLAQITVALTELCATVKNILGVGMMLMVVSAAAVYSIGQIMGAETRARASVWATSMFNGAIIAALIYLLVPYVLNQMLAGKVNVQCFFLF